jgi:hypothetical protein
MNDGEDLGGSGHGLLEVLSWHLPVGTEGNHTKKKKKKKKNQLRHLVLLPRSEVFTY